MTAPSVPLHPSPVRRFFVPWAFWVFVVAYALLLLYRPEFNLIDDHKFLDTVHVGRVLPPFIEYDRARFSPLLAQEYNVIAFASSSARAFYAFNVLELFAVAWLLVTIGQAVPGARHRALPYAVTAAILLSPGFTVSWFRLWVQEKNELLLLVLFLAAYLVFRARGGRIAAGVSLLCATLSLYSKESAFIPIAAIGFFGLLLDRAPSSLSSLQRRRWRTLHVLLLASCASFLGLYYGLVYRHRGTHLYGVQAGSKLMIRLHAITASLLREPLLIPGLVLLLFLVFLRPRVTTPAPFRVLLIATASLVGGYAVLGLSNVYYLLPACFAVPYLVVTVAETPALARAFRHPGLVLVASLLFVNQCVVAVQQFTLFRVSARNLQAMLPNLEQQLRQPTRTNIVLDGLDAGGSGEAFQSIAAYLRADGFTEREFDLHAYAPVEAGSFYVPVHSAFSYTDGSRLRMPQAGDLVVVMPGDPPEELQKFANSGQYALLFQTGSMSYSNVGLKTLIRRVLHQPLGADAIIDPNYAIYRKR